MVTFTLINDKLPFSQTLKGKFALLGIIAKQSKPFSRRTAIYAIAGLIEKIGDLKVSASYLLCYFQ